LILLTSLVTVVLAISGEMAQPWFTAHEPLAPALRITALVGAILLLAALLWALQFTSPHNAGAS
jgi:hypothetical protein